MSPNELQKEIYIADLVYDDAQLAYAEAINEFVSSEGHQNHYHYTHKYKVEVAKAEKKYRDLVKQLDKLEGVVPQETKVAVLFDDDDLPF